MKVLIVEDERDIAELHAAHIEGAMRDVSCTFASHGAEALLACQQQTFDLILTDHRMPVMNGLEFLTILRKWSQPNQLVPVIFLTTFVPLIQDSASIYESVYFVDKPVNWKSLIKLISMITQQPVRKEA